jgi:hypothetical protein
MIVTPNIPDKKTGRANIAINGIPANTDISTIAINK